MAGKSGNSGTPGNTIQEQADFDDRLRRVGLGWQQVCAEIKRMWRQGRGVYRVTLKGGLTGHDEVLVVLAAEEGGKGFVAFHGAEDPELVWVGLARRMAADKLKWREDEYYGG